MKYCLLLKWSLNIHPVDFLRNLFHYFHLSWRWVVHQLHVAIGQRRFSKNVFLSISTVFVCSCLPWIDRLAGWNASVLCWPAAWNKAGIIKPVKHEHPIHLFFSFLCLSSCASCAVSCPFSSFLCLKPSTSFFRWAARQQSQRFTMDNWDIVVEIIADIVSDKGIRWTTLASR